MNQQTSYVNFPKLQHNSFKPIALLVDGDGDQRNIYKDILSDSGLLVVEAGSVDDAKLVVEEINVDVVFYDSRHLICEKLESELKNSQNFYSRAISVVQLDGDQHGNV